MAYAFYSGAGQDVSATAEEPGPRERRAKPTGCHRSHGVLLETSLSSQQVAGARSVQSNLHDDRIGVGKQYPTNKTLPESYTEARE